jgi:hypothetical protein
LSPVHDDSASGKTHYTARAKLAARIGFRAKSYRGKSHEANALFRYTIRPDIDRHSASGSNPNEEMMPDKVNATPRKLRTLMILALTAASLSGFQPVAAAKEKAPAPAPRPSYARVADLVTASPAIAVINVKKMTALPAERAPGLAPGHQRFLVTADTTALIRGNDAMAKQANLLIDLALPPKAKPPKWAKRSFLVFGKVQDRVDFFQLLSSSALIAWSADNEALVRKVDAALLANDAPPLIQGVDSVFHVSGAVAGEGESQIFLNTSDGSQISLSIISKPDERPQFGVSLGEIVDEAAALPKPDTPLWYRLACFLPGQLPAKALAGQAPPDAAAATKDYAAFLKALGPCDRSIQPIE